MEKDADAFRTISEAAEEIDVPQHVLRFWETRFSQIKPMKRGGGRRYYRPEDMQLLRSIRQLLYGEGYTIRGVQRILKEQGARGVIALQSGGGRALPAGASQSLAPATPETSLSETAASAPSGPNVVPAQSIAPMAPSPTPRLNETAVAKLQAALAEIRQARRVLAATGNG